MVRFVIAALFTLIVNAALAGDFEDGVAAIERKDYATALKKWQSAAQQGNRDAQLFVGLMYSEGLGVIQDYKEAVRWFLLAAKQGLAKAQYKLALMYDKGQGVPQDYTRAHMWFNIAAIAGDKDSVKNRDIAAGVMSAQQIQQAQRMARDCMSSNFAKCD